MNQHLLPPPLTTDTLFINILKNPWSVRVEIIKETLPAVTCSAFELNKGNVLSSFTDRADSVSSLEQLGITFFLIDNGTILYHPSVWLEGTTTALVQKGHPTTILLARSRKGKGDSERKICSQDRTHKGKMPFGLADYLRHRYFLKSRN